MTGFQMNRRPKVLIVDDKLENLIALERTLAGLEVVFVRALSGNEALKRILEHDFAIALIDVQMPGMDGFETVELIRLDQRSRNLPVIFLTAFHKDDFYRVKGIQSGAVDFITKPIQPEILHGKVRVFLDLHENKQRLLAEIERRKQTEEELKRHRDQLEELAAQRTAELLEKTTELARSNEELEQFAYAASHDLREPLRMVSSYLQLLSRKYQGKLDADAEQFIYYAVDGAKRMDALIKDLLNLARIGTRGRPMTRVDAPCALSQAIRQLGASIQEAHASITYDSLPCVLADETQLTQLFQNLIANAIKYRGEETPQIEISAVSISDLEDLQQVPMGTRQDDWWRFAVKDNGIGIPGEHHQRIFVMFQRFHPGTIHPGTGIGLAICKRIVERHGGQIWVESEPGKGATFLFTMKGAGLERPGEACGNQGMTSDAGSTGQSSEVVQRCLRNARSPQPGIESGGR